MNSTIVIQLVFLFLLYWYVHTYILAIINFLSYSLYSILTVYNFIPPWYHYIIFTYKIIFLFQYIILKKKIAGDQDPYAPLRIQGEIFSNLGRGADRTWSIIADADHAVHLLEGRSRFVNILTSFVENAKKG